MKTNAFKILGAIQLFVAVGALPAGYLFFSSPDGSKMGMTTAALSGSPFNDFLIPGIVLFVVNGLMNLLGSGLSFFRSKYAGILGICLGLCLIIWVIVQVYSIGLNHFLQPTYFVIGIIELLLAAYITSGMKSAYSI